MPKVLVIGQVRTGTSLAMQMLDKAGLVCAGRAPAYEPSEFGLDATWESVTALMGDYDALKLPDLHANPQLIIPEDHDYKVIFTSRLRTVEQAKSMIKMLRAWGGVPQGWKPTKRDVLGFERRIRSLQREFYVKLIGRTPKSKRLALNFERMIMHPLDTARCISELIGQGDPEYMSEIVRHRATGCYPSMLEETLTPSVPTA